MSLDAMKKENSKDTLLGATKKESDSKEKKT